jgi:hypothetical protein
MLVSLDDVKTYLGINDSTYDDFLTQQIGVVSEAIEGYCGRKFEQSSYTQTFYRDDYELNKNEILLYHYPVISVTSVKDGDETITDYRLHYPTGHLYRKNGLFYSETVEVEYSAGYATVPSTVLHVVYSVVEQNYNKKKSGVALSFGSDVQSISIPGTISVTFDYTLDSNQRKNAYGVILGSYANILDQFRSERTVIGSGKIAYVE